MKNLDQVIHCYLMGIKGVAMTSIAQVLLDAGKQVAGCDVADHFVTKKILDRMDLPIEIGFEQQLPASSECVIYTSAHGGPHNPLVIQARQKGILTLSQAEVLAHYFNQKQGIAVSGVGGKTTVSAMIAWILDQYNLKPSFSVGVGEILGMPNTGRWQKAGQHFVAEADEYVVDPECGHDKELMVPRFSFLKPYVNVCTNLEFDHPDVYQNFNHTKEVFKSYFQQTQPNGWLIFHQDSLELAPLIDKIQGVQKRSYGQSSASDCQLVSCEVKDQRNLGEVGYQGQTYQLNLSFPGTHNLLNAMAACLAAEALGVDFASAVNIVNQFKGTKRRFEFVGKFRDALCFDDYAHHPQEITATIKALTQWCPDRQIIVAFQPHTFSRTKQLFDEFVKALAKSPRLVLLDIFPSAREKFDPSVSSALLAKSIADYSWHSNTEVVSSVSALTKWCQKNLHAQDAFLTMGAGDIYEVHEQLMML